MTIHEKLYNYYYSIQSKEMQSEIQGWKPMKMKSVKAAIKITFKNGDWLRVYQQDGSVEWY
ncbi:hypothetical protein AGR56_15745 [Clostridium sp. DMHC 10]|uniref:hypothetical protein n=1 Tax=Clostridium sp. DMHC 10 TaxID=747377 RepID=UPI00069D95F5|nr:hypothetical protein [Clostridium sp. DMHC 10]KOF57716.1 hypothetical protein AGR56_15745 [Clostridium sp. DMHC 10]